MEIDTSKNNETVEKEEFTAELFNLSSEFEDLRIELDLTDGAVVMNSLARRC